MNRQIKFRAWDVKKNKMFPVGVLGLFDNCSWQHSFNYIHNTQEWYGEDGMVIDPITMQFTGLLDKNGKEIFEGDWCTAKFRTRDGIQVIQGKIIMDEYMWCIDCTGCVGDDIFPINRPHDFEVIGNIYQNNLDDYK